MESIIKILMSIFLVVAGIAIGVNMSTPSPSKSRCTLDRDGFYFKEDTIHINSVELSKEDLKALITLSEFYPIRVN